MAYKAIMDVGKYSPGEIVPNDKAELWNKMYKNSPVQFVADEPVPVQKPIIIEPVKTNNPLDLNGDGKVDSKDKRLAAKVTSIRK